MYTVSLKERQVTTKSSANVIIQHEHEITLDLLPGANARQMSLVLENTCCMSLHGVGPFIGIAHTFCASRDNNFVTRESRFDVNYFSDFLNPNASKDLFGWSAKKVSLVAKDLKKREFVTEQLSIRHNEKAKNNDRSEGGSGQCTIMKEGYLSW